jgi:sugar phosphate isomerase/epimerase
MKLGFYTYSYVDRLKMDLEPVLETIAAAGYQGIDISATWHDDLDPALMPASVRRQYVATAQRLGLEIEAVVTHLGLVEAVRDRAPLNLQGAVDLARDVGARIATVHAGPFDGRPARPYWRAVVDYLKRACEHAGKYGVVIALDGVWTPFLIHTPQQVLEMLRAVDSPHLKHNYDPCYLAISGHDVAAATPLLLPHVIHVHVKDYVGRLHPNFQPRIPGEGVLDHARWLRLLHEAGYQGYVINECFPDAELDRACSVGYRTLCTLLAAHEAPPTR